MATVDVAPLAAWWLSQNDCPLGDYIDMAFMADSRTVGSNKQTTLFCLKVIY